jgi:hypothetical protein
MTRLYSTGHVAKVTGLSYRQLIYWEMQKAARPYVPPTGSGSRIGWCDDDIARLQVVAAVAPLCQRPRAMGIPVDLVAEVWGALEGERDTWSETLYLWHNGKHWRHGTLPGLTCAAFLCVDVVFVLRDAGMAA